MIITRAPLRIPLGGGGTDFKSYYSKYGGYILGFACDLYVYVVVHPILEPKIHLKYSKVESVEATSSGLDLLQNKVAAEAIRYIGLPTSGGLEISTFSDVPESSGLGGSSSFTCALLLALNNLNPESLPYRSEALFGDAFHVERELAESPGGMQDQFFAAKGGSNVVILGKALDTAEEEDLSGTSQIDLHEFTDKLYLVYTNSTRSSLDIAVRQDYKTQILDKDMLDSLERVKTIGLRIEQLLNLGHYKEVAALFTEHWESKLARDPGIVTPEMTKIWNTCFDNGALGGKLIGLGGGGYFLMYSEKSLKHIGGIPLQVSPVGAQIIHSSATPKVKVLAEA
jgi:D-glycero-alpha-D-manno-heptose-7-phosphate kinase